MIDSTKVLSVAVGVLFSVAVLGCERQGPMERAGERADDAVEDVRDAFNGPGPMERAGERVDDAVDSITE